MILSLDMSLLWSCWAVINDILKPDIAAVGRKPLQSIFGYFNFFFIKQCYRSVMSICDLEILNMQAHDHVSRYNTYLLCHHSVQLFTIYMFFSTCWNKFILDIQGFHLTVTICYLRGIKSFFVPCNFNFKWELLFWLILTVSYTVSALSLEVLMYLPEDVPLHLFLLFAIVFHISFLLIQHFV